MLRNDREGLIAEILKHNSANELKILCITYDDIEVVCGSHYVCPLVSCLLYKLLFTAKFKAWKETASKQ